MGEVVGELSGKNFVLGTKQADGLGLSSLERGAVRLTQARLLVAMLRPACRRDA